MVKRIVGKLWLSLLLLYVIGAVPVEATDIDEKIDTVQMEQARINMPDIKVYYYPASDTTSDAGQISGELDQKKLNVLSAVPSVQDEQGVRYYMLLDISASIGKADFEQIKQAVTQAQSMMTEKDQMTLITFGDQVSIVFENAGKTEDQSAVIGQLQNNDQTTLLLEAVKKTADLADQESYALNRSVFIIITDGEDFSKEATKSEALSTLQKKNIPLYALTVNRTASGAENLYTGELGEFARETGGESRIFGEKEAVSAMEELMEKIQSACLLTMRAGSNRISSGTSQLSVVFGNAGEVHRMNVYPVYYQPDTEAPEASLEKLSSKELKITYNEPVAGADDPDNFKVMYKGTKRQEPRQANYTEADEYCTILTFEDALKNGDYEITFTNITDTSMETHPLEKLEGEIGGDKEKEEKKEEEKEEDEDWKDALPVWAFPAMAGLAAVVLCGGILLTRKKKKQRQLQEDPSPEDREDTRGEPWSMTSSAEQRAQIYGAGQKHHVMLEEVPASETLVFEISTTKGSEPVRVPIRDKLTVGRSDRCDVYLDDRRMSREHFVVEKEGPDYYITDLKTTNGTMVNGVRIVGRRKLKNGDSVHAGTVEMKIRW